ncbi:nima-related kinase 5 [Cladorrhinum sp. PSN332]|nr:nima-related kinase 5 [Cladorrhinum sp. PSN332]
MQEPSFQPEWIWGDDDEITVFAQGYGEKRTTIFSFQLDKHGPDISLANRICNSFHRLEPTSEAATFPNPDAMRKALWDAVERVWPQCLIEPGLSKLDAIVQIDSADGSSEELTWKVYHHPLFPRFIQHLSDETLGTTRVTPSGIVVDFADLIRYEQLGGRGCATRVRLSGHSAREFFVFKGIDFRTFLANLDEEGDTTVRHLVQTMHRSNNLLQTMPPHRNIMPPPTIFVTLRFPPDQDDKSAAAVLCGTLQPLYAGGDVGARIEKSNEKGQRLPLDLKARWCADMAAAVAHTHRVAKTYHMDIKPGNFIADADDNLVLGDWEQSGAPPTTLAPEADGTWDVTEEDSDLKLSRPRFSYLKYQGPRRSNTDQEDPDGDYYSWHTWNVYPIWVKEHPFALELAEVFSLGRTTWMLLRQPEDMEFEEVEHPDDILTDWEGADDIPAHWKRMVDRCMAKDPNERPDVLAVAQFWQDEAEKKIHDRVPK